MLPAKYGWYHAEAEICYLSMQKLNNINNWDILGIPYELIDLVGIKNKDIFKGINAKKFLM